MFLFGNNGLTNVEVNEVKEHYDKSSEAIILDVRSVAEYQQAHIKGSKLIPLDQLPFKMQELAEYKDREILVLCHSGNRSLSATSMLVKEGFANAKNIKGGISSWYNAGYPIAS